LDKPLLHRLDNAVVEKIVVVIVVVIVVRGGSRNPGGCGCGGGEPESCV